MKDQLQLILSALAVLLLLPLAVTLIFSGKDAVSLQKELNIETYLPEIIYREMPDDYPEEAIKAQAVLARSSLKKGLEDGSISQSDLDTIAANLKEDLKKEEFLAVYEQIQSCITQTQDEVLVYQNQLCEGSFHRVSSGNTRDGKEVLGDDIYGYITGVDSALDMESKDYMTGQYFTPDEFLGKIREAYPDFEITEDAIVDEIKIVSRDSQGYVMEVKAGNLECSGEEFRKLLSLNSSNFTISNMVDEIRFLCRGVGHGLGMSQFGAGKMAENGSDYQKILTYYFPNVEIIVY